MQTIIPSTQDEMNVVIKLNRYDYDFPGYLYIVGIITNEVVALQRATVDEPDPQNDAHWVSVTENNATWNLTSINSTQLIKGGMTLRIKKPLSNGNQFGIGYM
jgi:hypothetical protein